MRIATRTLLTAVAVIVLLGASARVDAQAPAAAAAPRTLWSFLGIPQGFNKMSDSTLNRNGNHPGMERKNPLKRLADPANLQSDNPAIKAAAKIKADQDQAPQKIKAIKFLATVGCGCYPGVKEALTASLDDCTEEVRYEAAVALCKVAGSPCKNCEKTCCSAEVMSKLEEKAHGQDEKGCYKESSARVREAAAMAVDACRRKTGATTAAPLPPEQKKKPPEIPREVPSAPPRPLPPPPPSAAPAGNRAAFLRIESEPAEMPSVMPSTMPLTMIRIVTLPPDDRPKKSTVQQATALTPVSVEPAQGSASP